MVARFGLPGSDTRASQPSASTCAGASRRSPRLVVTAARLQSGHWWMTIRAAGPAAHGRCSAPAATRDSNAATKRFGNLAFHVAYEWLNAEFVDGPVDGLEPQYAPENLLRIGLTYRWRDRVKVSLLHTYVSQHFANDSNTAAFNRFYKTLDTAQCIH